MNIIWRMKQKSISVFFHNYYGQHARWLAFFRERMKSPFDLYYNIVTDSIYNMREESQILFDAGSAMEKENGSRVIVRYSSNKGKDIGGKLVMMDTCLHLGNEPDYLVLMHDKQSPHKIHNREWQQRLFRIMEPDFIDRALQLLNENPQTGIVATEDSVQIEVNKEEANNCLALSPVSRLREAFHIKKSDRRFVAGTMFWARSKPLLQFFTLHAPLDIRKDLEAGNVMDEKHETNTHAWERMLSWIITEQNFQLKTLNA